MAGIDKIYGTLDEWIELFDWLRYKSGRIQYIKYLNHPTWYDHDKKRPCNYGAISNFPYRVDKWLYKNCPLPWVKERIKKQYNGEPK